ncbi:MAG TPA: RNA polymerase sporulation sigma factor SigK [Candidatus Fimenecus excrementigallinarum]|uniref:RNA polymerase sigma factor n=1 Tax=Candidatus Fimenecus excrementigallinarum TaxID=2840816 RepID=A0A9D1IG34_9FIRM|nr:RNA polymerase sporulation sigma factor SigK [Candidatus Fimenecus excrementigallinarum]
MFLELLSAISTNILYFLLHIEGASSFPKPLSAKAEREALEAYRAGDESARDRLIEHNLRLVAHIIKKYYASYSDQDDLISIGTIGLIKAIGSYDGKKGTRLATYAARCIENEILMYFRSRRKSAQDISMNDPIDSDPEGNPLTLSEILYTDDTIADDLDRKVQAEKVRRFVRELTDERAREIIVRRYGLDGEQPETQREVADRLRISRSYVSRIEKRALGVLRSRFGPQ